MCETHSRMEVVVTVAQRLRRPHCAIDRPVTICPDFVLVRNEVRTAAADYRNQLFGLMYGNIPSCNSLESVYSFLERPIVHAQLSRINRRLGDDVFPVIPQCFFSTHRTMMYTKEFPCVAKVGAAHAGVGKMKVADHHDWEDFRSVVAMTKGDYCTGEPFKEGEYDLRIQKIGEHIRAFKRTSVSGAWKTNTGTSYLEEVEVSDRFRRWAEEASTMFGGLDILTVDAIHDAETDTDLILEVNGTSSGLSPDHADEDNRHIRNLVLQRMNDVICGPASEEP